MSQFARQFGTVLRERREACGLSQEALGERAKVHRTYVGKVERGEKDISLRVAANLARALDTHLSILLGALEKRGKQVK